MKKLIVTALIGLAAVSLSAQTMNSSYFLDHDNYRYRINPAFLPDSTVNNLIGIAMDNLLVTSQSNIGMSSFFFPVNGQLVTGLNKKVPAETFLGGLNDHNIFNAGANVNVLTVGFRTDPKGFGTVEFNVRSDNYVDIPKSLFSFLKLGSSKSSFEIKDFNVNSLSVAELALGYSRKIGDYVQIGARVKFMAGLTLASLQANSMNLVMNPEDNTIDVTSDGTLDIYSTVLTIPQRTNPDGRTVYDLSKVSYGKFGISGFGAAADIGLTVFPCKGLRLDLAAQDLGGLSWKQTITGKMSGQTKVNISGFSSDAGAAVSDILNFVPETAGGNRFLTLPQIFRVGARYSFPFYDRLSLGVLGTMETGSGFTYDEVRVGATVTPIDQISITANYGATTYGDTMGVAANFSLGAVQLFFGTDALIFEFSPQGIPVNRINTTFNMGLLFQIKSEK